MHDAINSDMACLVVTCTLKNKGLNLLVDRDDLSLESDRWLYIYAKLSLRVSSVKHLVFLLEAVCP